MILADFHIHSTFSDGKMTIPEIVNFYGQRGFQAIAITDHLCDETSFFGKAAYYLNRTLDKGRFLIYMEILKSERERAWDQYKMILFPGYEITKNALSQDDAAHFISLGIYDYVSPNLEVEEALKMIQSKGGLTLAAHPVSTDSFEYQTHYLWNHRSRLAQYMDAWEVASGKVLFEEVRKSQLPLIANSDLHHPKQINSWKTLIDSELHPEAILEAIRKQNLTFTYYNTSEVIYGDSPLPMLSPLVDGLHPYIDWDTSKSSTLPICTSSS